MRHGGDGAGKGVLAVAVAVAAAVAAIARRACIAVKEMEWKNLNESVKKITGDGDVRCGLAPLCGQHFNCIQPIQCVRRQYDLAA